MPVYDYECPMNDRVIEVRHGMSETIRTWGELCACADVDPGGTPADAPVRRAINRAVAIGTGGSAAEIPTPPGACGPGGCPCFPG